MSDSNFPATIPDFSAPFDWSTLGHDHGGQQTPAEELQECYEFFRANAASNKYLNGFSVLDDYTIVPADALSYVVLQIADDYKKMKDYGTTISDETKHFYEETAYRLLLTTQRHRELEAARTTPHSDEEQLDRDAAYILMVTHSGDPDFKAFESANSLDKLKSIRPEELASIEEELKAAVAQKHNSGTIEPGSADAIHNVKKLARVQAFKDNPVRPDLNAPAHTAEQADDPTLNIKFSSHTDDEDEDEQTFGWGGVKDYLGEAANKHNQERQERHEQHEKQQQDAKRFHEELQESYAFFRENADINPYLTGFSVIDDYGTIPADALMYALLNVNNGYAEEQVQQEEMDADAEHFYNETAFHLRRTAQNHLVLEDARTTPYSPEEKLNRDAAYILMVAHSGDSDLDFFVMMDSVEDLKGLPFDELAAFEEELTEVIEQRRNDGTVQPGSIEDTHDRNKLSCIQSITDAAAHEQIELLKRQNPEYDPESPLRAEYDYLREAIEKDTDLGAFAYIDDFTVIPALALKVFNTSLAQKVSERTGSEHTEHDTLKLAVLKKIERVHAAKEKTEQTEQDPERQYKKDCAFLRLCANAGDQDLNHIALTGMGTRFFDQSMDLLRRKVGTNRQGSDDAIQVPGLYDLSTVDATDFASMSESIIAATNLRRNAGVYSSGNDLYDYDCEKADRLTRVAMMNAHKAELRAAESANEDAPGIFPNVTAKLKIDKLGSSKKWFWVPILSAVGLLVAGGLYIHKHDPKTATLERANAQERKIREQGVNNLLNSADNAGRIRYLTEKQLDGFFKSSEFTTAKMETCAAQNKNVDNKWGPEVFYQMDSSKVKTPYCFDTRSTVKITESRSDNGADSPIQIAFSVRRAYSDKSYNLELGQTEDATRPYFDIRVVSIIPNDRKDEGGTLTTDQIGQAKKNAALYQVNQTIFVTRPDKDGHMKIWKNRQEYIPRQ